MRHLAVASLALALLVLGCQVPVDNTNKAPGGNPPPTTPTNPTTPTGNLDLSKPGQVLKSIQIGTVTLPKSLQDGSTNAGARALKNTSRAFGDVTTLTSLNLPSLKASGYNEFKSQVTRPPMVQGFLDGLKTSAAIANNTLELNQVTDLGDVTMNMGNGAPVTIKSAGKIKTLLSADGKTLTVFWNMSYPNMNLYYGPTGQPDPAYKNQQDFMDRGPRIPILLYFVINKSGELEMYASSVDMGMSFWTKYDPETKESIQAQKMTTSKSTYLNLVQPQVDGSFYIYSNSTGTNGDRSVYSNERLGYANDNFGGIVSASNYGTSNYLNVEYYDGNGNLIYQGYGNTAQNASQWSWFAGTAQYSTNLYNSVGHSAPATIRIKSLQTLNPETYTWETQYLYSTDGTNFTAFTPDANFHGWGLVFHTPQAGDVPGVSYVPTAGDVQYYSSGWSSGTDASGNWYNIQTYYAGFTVPSPETYFGQDYYVSRNYPLKNLLPLTGQYAQGFAVKQKEGETNYGWRDLGGEWRWQQGGTAPTPDQYQPGTLNSWVQYNYWLENTAYLDRDKKFNDNDPEANNSEKGDVSFNNINQMQVWYWDSGTATSVVAKSPAYYVYGGGALPPYFTVDASQTAAVDSTKATLESFYSKRTTQTVDSYLANFDATMASVQSEFP